MHFEADDFPALAGTVYFDGPVHMPTVLNSERKQRLVAVIWGQMTTAKGESVAMPRDKGGVIGKVMYSVGEATESQNRLSPHPFRWRLRHWLPVAYDERMDPQDMKHAPEPADEILEAMGDMRQFMTAEEREQDAADSRASSSLVMRLMLVWGRFLKTELIGRTNWDVDRAHKKLMGQGGQAPAADPHHHVAALRQGQQRGRSATSSTGPTAGSPGATTACSASAQGEPCTSGCGLPSPSRARRICRWMTVIPCRQSPDEEPRLSALPPGGAGPEHMHLGRMVGRGGLQWAERDGAGHESRGTGRCRGLDRSSDRRARCSKRG